MLYIYGANDPWSAEPFDCGKHAVRRECARYYVAGGNHGSRISQLPETDKAAATELVLRWAGLAPSDPAARQIDKAGNPKRNATLDKSPDYLRRGGL